MDENSDRLYTLLLQLVESMNSINSLLKEDETNLLQSDTQAIAMSNKRKQAIINEMNQCALEIQACLPRSENGLLLSLQEYIAKADHTQAAKIQALLKSLETNLSDGYQHLIRNNSVVIENLNFIREMWNKLTKLEKDTDITYEKPVNYHQNK